MLELFMIKGAQDACVRLKLGTGEVGMLGGLLGKAKSFGAGQLDAAKNLFSNVRGGFGGKFNPSIAGENFQAPEGFSPELGRAMHRQQAVGNLKTLAPSLLAGGGLYMLHRHRQQQEDQARQQAMMQQQGYGQPPM